MADIVAYNVKLKKKEKVQNPKITEIAGKGGSVRFAVKGVGSDGTGMYKFIDEETYKKLKSSGIEYVKTTSKAGKKSKSGKH